VQGSYGGNTGGSTGKKIQGNGAAGREVGRGEDRRGEDGERQRGSEISSENPEGEHECRSLNNWRLGPKMDRGGKLGGEGGVEVRGVDLHSQTNQKMLNFERGEIP